MEPRTTEQTLPDKLAAPTADATRASRSCRDPKRAYRELMDQEATAREEPEEALLWTTERATKMTSLSKTTLNRLADEGVVRRWRAPGHDMVRWYPHEMRALTASYAEVAPALEPQAFLSPEPVLEELQSATPNADGHARPLRRLARTATRPSRRRPNRAMTWAEYREIERTAKAST